MTHPESEVLAFLEQAEPRQLEDFLLARGWRKLEGSDSSRGFWDYENGDFSASILLPLSREFQDYSLRMRELAEALRQVHSDDYSDLLLDLLSISSDVVRVRSTQPVPPDGSIPFDEGYHILLGTRDLLRAAAKASSARRPFFGSRGHQVADRYLQALRLGQSARGSYIFNVYSTLSAGGSDEAATQEAQLPLSDGGFTRLVTRTLVQALKATRTALASWHDDRGFSAFMEAVADGLSAELCDALLVLLVPDHQEAIDVSVRWSDPIPDEAEPSFTFTRADLSPLEAASARLKSTESETDITIRGIIRQMRREDISEGSPFVVTLHVLESQLEARSVRVRLEWEYFHLATAAFDAVDQIEVRGEVVREGNFFWVYHPAEFRVAGGSSPSGPANSPLPGNWE